ncbi:hypothetical protein [Robertmurraya sp.]
MEGLFGQELKELAIESPNRGGFGQDLIGNAFEYRVRFFKLKWFNGI